MNCQQAKCNDCDKVTSDTYLRIGTAYLFRGILRHDLGIVVVSQEYWVWYLQVRRRIQPGVLGWAHATIVHFLPRGSATPMKMGGRGPGGSEARIFFRG